jgi:hypothetical protein
VSDNKGKITKKRHATRTMRSMQRPNLGLKEPEVKQENLAAGISTGNRSCLHLDFFVVAPTPGTPAVIL